MKNLLLLVVENDEAKNPGLLFTEITTGVIFIMVFLTLLFFVMAYRNIRNDEDYDE